MSNSVLPKAIVTAIDAEVKGEGTYQAKGLALTNAWSVFYGGIDTVEKGLRGKAKQEAMDQGLTKKTVHFMCELANAWNDGERYPELAEVKTLAERDTFCKTHGIKSRFGLMSWIESNTETGKERKTKREDRKEKQEANSDEEKGLKKAGKLDELVIKYAMSIGATGDDCRLAADKMDALVSAEAKAA